MVTALHLLSQGLSLNLWFPSADGVLLNNYSWKHKNTFQHFQMGVIFHLLLRKEHDPKMPSADWAKGGVMGNVA